MLSSSAPTGGMLYHAQRAEDLIQHVEQKAEADAGHHADAHRHAAQRPKMNDSAISIITATDSGEKILLHMLSW